MAIKKISEFEKTTTANDTDVILIESGGVGKSISIDDLAVILASKMGISLDGTVPKFTGQVNDSGTANKVWGAVFN